MKTRPWTIGQQLIPGLLVPLVMLVVLGAASFRSAESLLETNRWVTHTYQVLIAAEQFLSHFKDAETGQRGFLITGKDDFLEPYAQALKSIEAEYDALQRLTDDNARQEERLARLRTLMQAKLDAMQSMIELRRRDGLEGVIRTEQLGLGKRAMDAIRAAMAEVTQEELTLLKLREAEADDTERDLIKTLLGGISGTIVIVVLLGAVSLRGVKSRIGNAIAHIQSAAAELQAAATQQAQGAKEQATASDEVSTTMKELLSTSRQIAESTQRVTQVAATTASAARTGNDTVQRAQEAIDGVQRQVEDIIGHMLEFSKKSQEIGGILDIINELADQTNILAINATIEAAGAGNAGRRFSVVAEEVRKLADRVGGSTKEIRSLIEEIRAAASTTVIATETGSKAVEAGTRQFGEVAVSFKRIMDLVSTTAQASREIELSTKQQATAVEQVNAALLDVARTARETERSSSQTLLTSSELASLSRQLNQLIQRTREA